MRTIGRRRPKSSPRGDAVGQCSYCGVKWLRSQLVRDRAGLYACPQDRDGRDVVTLSLLNAKSAAEPRGGSSVPSDGIVSAKETITQIPGPTFGAWVPVIQR